MARVYRDKKRKTNGIRPWCIDYRMLNGKRRQEVTQAATKEEARAILRCKISEIEKARTFGLSATSALKPLTFQDFVEREYLQHSKASTEPSTFKTNQYRAQNVMPFFGKVCLRAITAGDMTRYVDQRMSTPMKGGRLPKPATANRERAFVCAVLNEARLRGYIQQNPISDVKKLKEHNQKSRWLNDQEEKRLLAFAPEWLHPLILIGIHTGMRRQEMLDMKWSDVDREQGFIQIPRSKGGRVRHVPINAVVRGVLDSIPPHLGPEGPSPYVFVNPANGRPYTGSGVYHAFKEAAKQAGIEDVVFHTLRHTTVSRLIQADVHERKIREMIGHSSSQMTDRYAHLAPHHLREAADALVKRPFPARDARYAQEKSVAKQASL